MKKEKRFSRIDHDLAERQARRHLEVCLVASILFLILYFGLGNFIADTPEPEFWLVIEAAERTLLETIIR